MGDSLNMAKQQDWPIGNAQQSKIQDVQSTVFQHVDAEEMYVHKWAWSVAAHIMWNQPRIKNTA